MADTRSAACRWTEFCERIRVSSNEQGVGGCPSFFHRLEILLTNGEWRSFQNMQALVLHNRGKYASWSLGVRRHRKVGSIENGRHGPPQGCQWRKATEGVGFVL